MNQFWMPYFCGTPDVLAEYLNEQPQARLGPYLPLAGSLDQEKPFGPDLVTGKVAAPWRRNAALPVQNTAQEARGDK